VSGLLAVAIHDVEPRSSARIRAIREWLLDRGVARVTLLVIPAAELHPGHVATLQALIDLAVGRDAVVYDELLV
jgi:hypothetical protein